VLDAGGVRAGPVARSVEKTERAVAEVERIGRQIDAWHQLWQLAPDVSGALDQMRDMLTAVERHRSVAKAAVAQLQPFAHLAFEALYREGDQRSLLGQLLSDATFTSSRALAGASEAGDRALQTLTAARTLAGRMKASARVQELLIEVERLGDEAVASAAEAERLMTGLRQAVEGYVPQGR
jgi:hypothetical protein